MEKAYMYFLKSKRISDFFCYKGSIYVRGCTNDKNDINVVVIMRKEIKMGLEIVNQKNKILFVNFKGVKEFLRTIRFLNFELFSQFRGFFSELNIRGIGYKCLFLGRGELLFYLGYSHFVYYKLIEKVFVFLKKGKLFIFSRSKILLGDTIFEIKHIRIPDAYKSKGIIGSKTILRLKEGKKR